MDNDRTTGVSKGTVSPFGRLGSPRTIRKVLGRLFASFLDGTRKEGPRQGTVHTHYSAALNSMSTCGNAKIGTIVPIFLLFFAFSWIGFLLIRQPRKIVHACVQRLRDPLALFESIIPLSAFNFRVVALVDSRQHLHLHLGQPLAFS